MMEKIQETVMFPGLLESVYWGTTYQAFEYFVISKSHVIVDQGSREVGIATFIRAADVILRLLNVVNVLPLVQNLFTTVSLESEIGH